jgi:hypothetical protein
MVYKERYLRQLGRARKGFCEEVTHQVSFKGQAKLFTQVVGSGRDDL